MRQHNRTMFLICGRAKHFGPVVGTLTLVPTAAHGVRLLSVHTALNRPQVIGSTLHALGTAAHVANEVWADHALKLHFSCTGHHKGQLVVYVPTPFVFDSVEGIPGSAVARQGECLVLSVSFLDTASLTLQFR